MCNIGQKLVKREKSMSESGASAPRVLLIIQLATGLYHMANMNNLMKQNQFCL